MTYTSLPYVPYMDSTGRGCGANKVNSGTAGKLDGVTLDGWYDADGSENGDKCSWTNLQNRTFANGYSFTVQPSWSNQWRNQYGYGCYHS